MIPRTIIGSDIRGMELWTGIYISEDGEHYRWISTGRDTWGFLRFSTLTETVAYWVERFPDTNIIRDAVVPGHYAEARVPGAIPKTIAEIIVEQLEHAIQEKG